MARIYSATFFEDTGGYVLFRVQNNAGVNITQATISSIALNLIDDTTKAVVGSEYAVDKTVTVFDTLQTDARWTDDATGYNFAHKVTPAMLPSGDRLLIGEYRFTPTSGDPWTQPVRIHVLPVYAS